MRFQKFALFTIAPYLLVIAIFPACFSTTRSTTTSADSEELKFHFGDRIYITSGFYKGSRGRITKYYGSGRYEADVDLSSSDGKYNRSVFMDLSESGLVEDASDN